MVLTVGVLTFGSLVEACPALVGALLTFLGCRWGVARGIGSTVLGSGVVREERCKDKEGGEHRGLWGGGEEYYNLGSEGNKYGLSCMP